MYNVLIVDDEQIEREGLRDLISATKLPFYVHLASDGQVALNYIKEHQNIDILITDIKMSFMDGLSLIDEAHRIHPNLPVIIFSAYDKFDYAQKAISLDVADYLLKPIEPDLFLLSMQKAIHLCEKNRIAETTSSTATDKKDHHLVLCIKSIIESEYNKDISLEYIAGLCQRSPSYLSSIFSTETGQTVMSYIKEFRMAKASDLLINTNLKIAEISTIVGYSNPAYFNKVFQSFYHVTPGIYREEHH
jgi:two-component system response regulator YesN